MMRREQNTIIPLNAPRSRIAAHEPVPAPFLQINCKPPSSSKTGPIRIVRVAGRIDCITSDELFATIERLLDCNRLTHLIIDLSGVTRMDSSGLGALLTILRGAQDRGVRLTLCAVPKPLCTMLERMRLAKLFEIGPALDEDLAS